MKVRVSSIPPSGLEINDLLPLDKLNARMNEGRDNDIIFLEAPRVQVTVLPSSGGAETRGTVRTRYRQPCGRCAEDIERDLEIETDFIFAPAPEHGNPRDYEDDIGISYFHGDSIELDNVIEEALILSLSPYWHPPCDKQGKCLHCGKAVEDSDAGNDRKSAKRQDTVSLGDLLKKAGVATNGGVK